MSLTTDERVTRLEAQREADMKDASEIRKKIDQVDEKIDALDAKIDSINSRFDKQTGFVAGAMAVLTLIWGVIGAIAVAGYNYFVSKGADL